jgi:hydroxyacylglutathione hydrolase
MQEDQPVMPANILNVVATNQGKLPLTPEGGRAARPLTVEEVVVQLQAGQVIVDTRSQGEFGAGHIPGALNMQLSSGEFEQRVGWVAPADAPIILVSRNEADAQFANYKMAFIALDGRIAGFLEGGMDAWRQAGLAVAALPQLDVHTLHERLATSGIKVLDVRERDEWAEGHVEGAVQMSFKEMREHLGDLPFSPQDELAIICASGKRSSTAAAVLLRAGFGHGDQEQGGPGGRLYNVAGGMVAWKKSGYRMLDADGNACSI